MLLSAGGVLILCPVTNCGRYVQLSFQSQFEVFKLGVEFQRIQEQLADPLHGERWSVLEFFDLLQHPFFEFFPVFLQGFYLGRADRLCRAKPIRGERTRQTTILLRSNPVVRIHVMRPRTFGLRFSCFPLLVFAYCETASTTPARRLALSTSHSHLHVLVWSANHHVISFAFLLAVRDARQPSFKRQIRQNRAPFVALGAHRCLRIFSIIRKEGWPRPVAPMEVRRLRSPKHVDHVTQMHVALHGAAFSSLSFVCTCGCIRCAWAVATGAWLSL